MAGLTAVGRGRGVTGVRTQPGDSTIRLGVVAVCRGLMAGRQALGTAPTPQVRPCPAFQLVAGGADGRARIVLHQETVLDRVDRFAVGVMAGRALQQALPVQADRIAVLRERLAKVCWSSPLWL